MVNSSGDLTFSDGPAGVSFDGPGRQSFIFKLTSTGANPYTAKEVNAAGAEVAGPSAATLYELSGSTVVPVDTIVVAFPNPFGDGFVFVGPQTIPTPSIEVKESDGTPDYTGVTSLEFDQADGFILSQPGTGRAKVNLTLPPPPPPPANVGGWGAFGVAITADDTPTVCTSSIFMPADGDFHFTANIGAQIALDCSSALVNDFGLVYAYIWNATQGILYGPSSQLVGGVRGVIGNSDVQGWVSSGISAVNAVGPVVAGDEIQVIVTRTIGVLAPGTPPTFILVSVGGQLTYHQF